MLYLDNPQVLRVGDLQIAIKGWYAGESPLNTMAVVAGPLKLSVLLEDRPDVAAAYPHFQTRGFRCVLNVLETDFEPAYSGSGPCLRLTIRADERELQTFQIPA